jgi:enoyl-CoA hydratase/carnithine racemase
MSSLLKSERRGRIAILTLNDPKTRNALGDELVETFVAELRAINRDPSVSCLILTGAGEGFSSGGNVKDMKEGKSLFKGSPADMRNAYAFGIQQIPRAMYDLEVPAIAAVNGAAVGAGCDLSMMCDMRIASETASFAESFLRVGLISGDGGAWFLSRVVGLSRASEMAYTGDPVPAQKALDWGMVSEVVPQAKLIDTAIALAERVVRQPPQALRLMKRLIREAQVGSLANNLELAAVMQATVQHTADHREAVNALLEKRAPKFEGK